jgi:multidrug efflux system outer membrane protein
MMHARILAIAIAGMTLAGCLVGPDYQRPDIQMPLEFQGTIEEGEAIANVRWWELFEDPQLNELVTLSLENNRDLRVAIARVDEARARLGVSRADQFPTLDGAGQANRGNPLAQVFPGLGTQDNFFLGLQAAYDVDLWGKYRRSSEAARAELLATEDNQRTVLITLVADVASTYLLLRDLDHRVDISKSTLTTRHKSTALIQARFDQGTVPLLDVNQAQIQEATAAAQFASFQRQTIEAENLLNVLVGQNPRPIVRGRKLNEDMVAPVVPAGLPSRLLEQRPDIRAAEASLAAQTARIGYAQTLRYPSIILTGDLGLASTDLDILLESDQKVWNINIDIFGPIFDANKRKRNVQVEKARTEQALNNYEQTVLRALQEVEDALAGIRWFREELAARDFQVRAAQSASELSWARYDGGVTSFLEVLESDRSLFNAQLTSSRTRRLELNSIVRLYKALGGGWIQPEEIDEDENLERPWHYPPTNPDKVPYSLQTDLPPVKMPAATPVSTNTKTP